MNIKIISAGKNTNYCKLSFTCPTEEEIKNIEQQIIKLCRGKAGELYGMNFIVGRLETELQLMKKTGTAFHFALIKEITDLSREEGYPVMIQGALSGSVIAYLLGISYINPMKAHYRCSDSICTFCFDTKISTSGFGIDMPDKICQKSEGEIKKYGFNIPFEIVWGSFYNPQIPDFSLSIAAPIRHLIKKRLNAKFGAVNSYKKIYKEIIIADSKICENIGIIAKKTGVFPTSEQYKKDVYIEVLKYIAKDSNEMLAEFIENKSISEKEYARGRAFTEEIETITECDFKTLTRIYAYLNGSFTHKKSLENIYKPDFFVSKDEFFEVLTSYGMSDDIAFDFIKHAFWSYNNKHNKYEYLLDEYNIPLWIKNYFSEVNSLWSVAPCISRLQLKCVMAWYEINYPNCTIINR